MIKTRHIREIIFIFLLSCIVLQTGLFGNISSGIYVFLAVISFVLFLTWMYLEYKQGKNAFKNKYAVKIVILFAFILTSIAIRYIKH